MFGFRGGERHDVVARKRRSPEAQSRDDLHSELKRYGITPVQLTVFDWAGYRYSTARDVIAAAKRL